MRLYKTKRIDLFKENFGKNPEKTCKTGKNCNIFTFQKNLSVKMQKTNLLGLKIVHLFPKIWLFWEKKIVLHFVHFLAMIGAPSSSELLNTLQKAGLEKKYDSLE